ncbi:MAG: hypothetical protein KatS3mg057_0708 [Herpetosiphonaceae bacterium]|nr:MAG: hypothetical protein KatS3mg057_0708 [Herpetosiphonaceae bacterium]
MLENLVEMKTLLETLYPSGSRHRLRPGSEIERLLEQPDDSSVQRRRHVEAILAHAQASGWLDHPTRQRLASGDDVVMLAALNELAMARFLELRGARLQANPPGRGRRIGEFLVTLDKTSFFLEVKTLVAPLQDSYRSATQRAISEAAAGIRLPAILEIELQACPSSGVSIRDLRYYLEQAAQQLLSGAHEPPAYIHRSGMALRVLRALPLPSATTETLEVRFVDWQPPQVRTEDRWRERLLRALRGAYEQLPYPAEPSLVAVVNYSEACGSIQPLLAALSSGFLRPNQHRRLSAVGAFEPLPGDAKNESLAIIHNPWAARALPCEALALPDVLQLCLLPASC